MDNGRPVKIASFASLPQAELAQSYLAAHGIAARLGNAMFLSLCWYLSQAVGGATLFVCSREAQQARDLLTGVDTEDESASPPWQCVKCGERADATWGVCWRCGTSRDGIEDPEFGHFDVDSDRLQDDSDDALQGRLLLLVVLLLMAILDSLLVMVALPAALLVYLCIKETEAGEETTDHDRTIVPDAEPILDAAGQSLARRRRAGKEIVMRAWQASMIGFLEFPPLLLYSAYLLSRIDAQKWPLDTVSRCRYRAAYTLSVIGILMFGVVFLALICVLAMAAPYDFAYLGSLLVELIFPDPLWL